MEKPQLFHLLDLAAHSPERIGRLLDTAGRFKNGELGGPMLAGRTVAMIFRKSSTRTRVSAETAVAQLGGHAVFITEADSQIGRGESIADTARVLSRYVDAILIRTYRHDDVVELARCATVPVVNALTDLAHPCQLLADLQTTREEFGEDLSRVRVAWVGDGNNVANSWINAAAAFGFELRVAYPDGYAPETEIVKRALGKGARLSLTHDREAAVVGAHVVTTDVWASMGQESERERRAKAFRGWIVDEALFSRARADAIFLHCLPAHRGEEVSAGVIDGPRSRVFDQAENRLHTIKAVLREALVRR